MRSTATGYRSTANTQTQVVRPAPHSPSCRRPSHAVGLVELMITLAICAALLTAVAAAVNASFAAYKVNQENSTLTQRGRLTMNRILATIRVNKEHAPVTAALVTTFGTGTIVADSGIRMYDASGTLVKYSWNATTKDLSMTEGTDTRVLLNGVTNFVIKFEPMKSPTALKTGAGYDLLKRATVEITLKTDADTSKTSETTGKMSLTLSSSTMPRRNVW